MQFLYKHTKNTIFKRILFFNKVVFLSLLFLLSIKSASSQSGPYLRISLGYGGIMKEFKTFNKASFTIVTKNHAIGWGFQGKFAIYFHDFGALVKKDFGKNYHYINLDAYGLGLSYRNKKNINFHVSGGYSTVHFSNNLKNQGKFIEDGYAISLAIDKKWAIFKILDIGVGPHLSYYKTNNYQFINLGFNIWIDLYLFSQY